MSINIIREIKERKKMNDFNKHLKSLKNYLAVYTTTPFEIHACLTKEEILSHIKDNELVISIPSVDMTQANISYDNETYDLFNTLTRVLINEKEIYKVY